MLYRFAPTLLLALIVVSCGGEQKQQVGRDAAGGKKYGGRYRLNIVRGSPTGLDPVGISTKEADDIASQIFDRLIDLDDSLKLVPELAHSLPTVSADGRTYHFELRTDVRFQDNKCFPGGKGRRLTAEDVRYSFSRCCDPRANSIAFWAFQDKVKGATEYYTAIEKARAKKNPVPPSLAIEGFRVVNDSTFEIELIRPYAPFLYCLVNSLGSIVPHEGVETYGRDFSRNPVGSGPFIFTSWKPDQDLLLTRNPNYWGKDNQGNRLPFLSEIQYRFIKDDKQQLNEFLSGSLEESFNIPTERFADVFDISTKQVKPDFEKYQVQSSPAMLTWFIDFNTQRAPFTSADVRRAFNYAIDREKIVRFALQNSPFGAASHGLVPPVFPGYPIESVKGYSYNPEEAKKSLAAAGYPMGKGFPTVTLSIYIEPRLRQVAEVVQEMLKTTLNISVEVQSFETGQLLEQAELGKLEFWGTRWYGDYPDPETYLLLLNGELVPKNPDVRSYPNSSRYNSAAYNDLFHKGVATIDKVAQMKYYAEAEAVAMADAPVIPLFYEMHYRLLQPRVHDNRLDAMARYDMKYVWLGE